MRAIYVRAAKSYAEHKMEKKLRRLMDVIPGVNERFMLSPNGWIETYTQSRRLQCSREQLASIQLQQHQSGLQIPITTPTTVQPTLHEQSVMQTSTIAQSTHSKGTWKQ